MPNTDDFEAAKAVADQLKELDAARQARILRWVAESLGIEPPKEPRGDASSAQRETPQTAHASTGGASTNIKSFIEAKSPKSDNQFAAAVAYFYRFEAPQGKRHESITAEMLQEATRLAGRNRLGDPGKTLRNAKDMGYLDPAERGEYKINSVGENLVAMTLPAQGRVVTGKTARAKPAKKVKR
jgi:hypothetical protein